MSHRQPEKHTHYRGGVGYLEDCLRTYCPDAPAEIAKREEEYARQEEEDAE